MLPFTMETVTTPEVSAVRKERTWYSVTSSLLHHYSLSDQGHSHNFRNTEAHESDSPSVTPPGYDMFDEPAIKKKKKNKEGKRENLFFVSFFKIFTLESF